MASDDPESSALNGFFASVPFNRADVSLAVQTIILIAFIREIFK